MRKEEALEIIRQERLRRINWFDEDNLRENEVGIKRIMGGWEVYITGERSEIIAGTECRFADADNAYEALIRKARYVERLYE